MGKRSNKRKKRNKKLQQSNTMQRRTTSSKSIKKSQVTSSNKSSLLVIVSDFLQKVSYPSIYILYLLALLYKITQNPQGNISLSIFMAFFSVSIAFFFSNMFEKLYKYIVFKIKITFFMDIKSLIQIFFVIIVSFFGLCIYNSGIIKIINLSDILSWISILIFFVDRNIYK